MKSVIFDIGNVLLDWDPKIPLRRYFKQDQEIETFFQKVDFMAWNISLDAGRDWDEALTTLGQAHPEYEIPIKLFQQYWHESVKGAIEPSVEVLTDLKSANIPLYAITNFSEPRWLESQERFSFLANSFKDIVVSGREKLVKPHKAIFELFLTRNELNADQCIFIDDSAANITTASELGFNTILFSRENNLRSQLQDFGIPC